VSATLEDLGNFAFTREATRVGLAVDQVPFHEDVEDAAAAAVQLHLCVEALYELCFQPGSVREVVSGAAVLDSDVHGFLVATEFVPGIPECSANSGEGKRWKRDSSGSAWLGLWMWLC
jgi:hypothetical protein